MTYPVFIKTDENINDLNIADTISLYEAEAHHVFVMRLKENDILDIVDGAGMRMRSKIKALQKNNVQCEILEKIFDDKIEPEIILVQALAKNGRDEQAVESCVELGIRGVIPWKAQRCISTWTGNKIKKSRIKWENIALAAVKQSRQSYIVNIADLVDSNQLANMMDNDNKSCKYSKDLNFFEGKTNIDEKANLNCIDTSISDVKFIVLHESATQYLAEIPEEYFKNSSKIYLIVGPEGGITDVELEKFAEKGALKVKLSDSVLRTSNAGVVAATIVATKTNMWKRRK